MEEAWKIATWKVYVGWKLYSEHVLKSDAEVTKTELLELGVKGHVEVVQDESELSIYKISSLESLLRRKEI